MRGFSSRVRATLMEQQTPTFRHPVVRLFQSWALLAVGVLIGAAVVPGISYDSAGTLILVVVLLSLLNAFLKPLLLLFTLPFIMLTMGLGILLINAVLFLLAGQLVPGFEVAGFWAAFFGALIISFVGFLLNVLLPIETSYRATIRRNRRTGGTGRKDDDVIDI